VFATTPNKTSPYFGEAADSMLLRAAQGQQEGEMLLRISSNLLQVCNIKLTVPVPPQLTQLILFKIK
jgi:hypothetical protein